MLLSKLSKFILVWIRLEIGYSSFETPLILLVNSIIPWYAKDLVNSVVGKFPGYVLDDKTGNSAVMTCFSGIPGLGM